MADRPPGDERKKRIETGLDLRVRLIQSSGDQIAPDDCAAVDVLAHVFSIRGVGFYSETIAAASTVTIYVDQIPLPYARMTARPVG
jgi:hypothetical protein